MSAIALAIAFAVTLAIPRRRARARQPAELADAERAVEAPSSA
jgi:hypothetical protein